MEEADEILAARVQDVTGSVDLTQLDGAGLAKCIAEALKQVGFAADEEGNAALVAAEDLESLPTVQQKHKVCKILGKMLGQAVGTRESIKYHHILYPTETSRRQILSEVAAVLAKQTDQTSSLKPNRSKDATKRPRGFEKKTLGIAVKAWTKETWKITGGESSRTSFRTIPISESSPYTIPQQIGPHSASKFIPSVIESLEKMMLQNVGQRRNDHGAHLEALRKAAALQSCEEKSLDDMLASVERRRGGSYRGVASLESSTAFSRLAKFGVEDQSNVIPRLNSDVPLSKLEVEDPFRIEPAFPTTSESDTLAMELESIKLAQETLKYTMLEIEQRRIKATEMLDKVQENQSGLELKYRIHKRVLDLLPNAEENIVGLERSVPEAEVRFASLKEEWINVEQALLRSIKERQDMNNSFRKQMQQKELAIQRLEKSVQEIAEKVHFQERYIEKAKASLEKAPKQAPRSAYTKRIFDIIKQVRKQDLEILKVIDDIKKVQQTTNAVSERLHRAEAVTDEIVFLFSDESRRDAASAQAYRYLHDMRVLFDELIDLAQLTGKVENKTRDYLVRANMLRSRVNTNTINRVLEDLNQINTENTHLQAAAQVSSNH